MDTRRKSRSKTPAENIILFTEEEGFAVIEGLMKSYKKDCYCGRVDALAQSVNCKYSPDS